VYGADIEEVVSGVPSCVFSPRKTRNLLRATLLRRSLASNHQFSNWDTKNWAPKILGYTLFKLCIVTLYSPCYTKNLKIYNVTNNNHLLMINDTRRFIAYLSNVEYNLIFPLIFTICCWYAHLNLYFKRRIPCTIYKISVTDERRHVKLKVYY